jgi:hypothetical protein
MSASGWLPPPRPLRPCDVPLQAIESRKQQLDVFFRRAAEPAISDEVRSDLAKHGIVLICGFVERSVETIIMEKIAQRAHVRVQNFVRTHFKRGTNYNCEAIAQLLDRFDLAWSTKFRAHVKTEVLEIEACEACKTFTPRRERL